MSQKISDETILDAARKVICEKGEHFTLAEVAEKAQVGVGTIYRHFHNKDSLEFEVLKSRTEIVINLARSKAQISDPWQALEEFIFECSQIMIDDLSIRNLFVKYEKQRLLPEKAQKQTSEPKDNVEYYLEKIVKNAKAKNLIKNSFKEQHVFFICISAQAIAEVDTRRSGNPNLNWKNLVSFTLEGIKK